MADGRGRLDVHASVGAKYNAILDAIPDHLALLDAEGNILSANERWMRFAQENGGEPDAYVGTNYVTAASASGDAIGDAVAEGLQDVLARRRARFDIEYPCHAPDQERWFRMSVTRVVAGPVRAVTTHTDITDRVVGERRRAQSRRDAQEKARLRREADLRHRILNIVNHQIATPLTPMRLHVAALRKEAPTEARLQILDRNLDRLENLQRDLQQALEVSSLEHVETVPTAWAAFWKDTAASVAAGLDIGDRVRVEAAGDAEVPLAPVWCRRLLRELLENAATFAPEGPIDVVAKLGREATLRVQDRGPGIPEAKSREIFEAFAESGSMRTAGGPGLGLFLVDRVARLHGGAVRYEPGAPGSLWIVTFPRRPQRHAPRETALEGATR